MSDRWDAVIDTADGDGEGMFWGVGQSLDAAVADAMIEVLVQIRYGYLEDDRGPWPVILYREAVWVEREGTNGDTEIARYAEKHTGDVHICNGEPWASTTRVE